MNSLVNEWSLMLRDRALVVWALVLIALSSLALSAGFAEVQQQRDSIATLRAADQADRRAVLAQQEDWGGAAYSSFHLTYDPPSDFAFAALGRRDEDPWKHRVRLLALEGQIHERDAGNPLLALVGRFDFAFLAAFVVPLVLIALLHDLQASERLAGRHALLVCHSGSASSPWRMRAFLRASVVFLSLVLPLVVAAIASAVTPGTLLVAIILVLAHVVFWAVLCLRIAAWEQPPAVLLAALVAIWLLLAVMIPAGGRLAIDRAIPLPPGADILTTQREAVNGAWDLPKAQTMNAFLERHPEWADFADIQRPFEWKWFYAFQQVGDQKAEALAEAYAQGRRRRDRAAALLAIAAPPALLERSLQALAGTDLKASLAYEARVRRFHADLRSFFYPKLFRDEAYDSSVFDDLPQYRPGDPRA